MLKRKANSISVHDDALMRKVIHMDANPDNIFHTIAVDERDTFADGQYADNYSGHHVYYRRGNGRYTLGKMHKVESEEELRQLLEMPDSEIPELARGKLPPPPPLKVMEGRARIESEKRSARDKKRKLANRDKLKAQAQARYQKTKAKK